jgi:hypothetical protein
MTGSMRVDTVRMKRSDILDDEEMFEKKARPKPRRSLTFFAAKASSDWETCRS